MNNSNDDMFPVGAIKHHNERRVLIPTTEMAGEEMMAVEDMTTEGKYRQFRHEFNRGRDPELYWLDKYENDDETKMLPELRVDTRSLYNHEEILPEMLINQLYSLKADEKAAVTASLFGNDWVFDEKVDELERITGYYRHSAGWRNRLIQGDSLLVMNSLLQREGMAGKVQMVYVDPPYGIKFGSNWQNKLNSLSVKDNDESVSCEPEMIKAYRDTWELGIHSYLSYLRDRLVLARELLTKSGSCFVQISDENVHLVRNIMDEVFGGENFVSQIFYQKTAGAGSPGELLAPASVGDYIIWYARNKSELKYYKLFLPKVFGGEGSSGYNRIELADGTRMSIADWEKINAQKFNYDYRPYNSKVYTLGDLTSQNGGDIGRFEVVFKGRTFLPSRGVWTPGKDGMDRLIKKNRVDISSKGQIRYVRYFDDFPMIELNNLWTDTVSQNLSDEKLFVVQTASKAIRRCILMTTDPGDLVLDPTCGSGTTAYVAEQWGRRWITMDTSRIALNIAKKRLSTAKFPYYELFDKEHENIRQGFVYARAPHIRLRQVANNEEFGKEILYDRPNVEKNKIRVSGPFTVESLQSSDVINPDALGTDSRNEAENFRERIFMHLTSSGIRNGAKGEQAIFYNIEPISNPYLNAKGHYKDGEGKDRLAYFHIGPKFGTVSKAAVTKTIQEFRAVGQNEGASWLCILGFSFEDNINEKDYNLGSYVVSKVRMHDDLMQDGLLKKDKKAASFVTIGEPDVALIEDECGKTVHVEIRGLDIYDPIKDVVKPRSIADIAYWEIDDNYNGERFIVRGLHFCGGDRDEFDNWRKGLKSAAPGKAKKNAEHTLRLEFNDDAWETLYGFKSNPIEKSPSRRIAVRVISQFGEESTKILTIK